MGTTMSTETRQHKRIEKMIKEDGYKEYAVYKLLLLGAGECGKSTVLKQIQIVHAGGFSEVERQQRRSYVYENVLRAISALCQAMAAYGYQYAHFENEDNAMRISKLEPSSWVVDVLPADMVICIQRLWADPQIKRCFERRAELQLTDSAKYFLDEMSRIGQPHYVPNEQDILMIRVPTAGISEIKINIGSSTYRIFDVGGQRSERRKWLHCFDNVHAVIFVIAVSEFNQTMREDATTNRLHDSLQLFEALLNSDWFIKTAFIVFLNKRDLLEEKLQRGLPFQQCFPEYTGENSYLACINFLHERVRVANAQPSVRDVYVHETCATDTGQTQAILDSVFSLVLKGNVKGLGMSE